MYSTPSSLHIALDSRLQQLNSNRKQSIHPEQYDMALNDGILTVIKQRCSPKLNSKQEGFEDSIKRLDDLKSLKRTCKASIYFNDTKEQFYDLPSNYYHYIASKGNVLYNRMDIIKNIVPKYKYVTIIDFSSLSFTGKEIIYTCDEGTITNEIVTPKYHLLTKSNKSKFYYFNYIKDSIKSKYDIDCYYENYKGEYYNNSLIFVTEDIDWAITSATIIGATVSEVLNPICTETFVETWLQGATVFVNMGSKKIDLISSQSSNDINNDFYLSKNQHLNPTCTIQNDVVHLKTNNTFLFKEVELEYIKYPRLIDSRIEQMTDVTITDEILDIAVSNLSGILKDETYKINKQIEQQNN